MTVLNDLLTVVAYIAGILGLLAASIGIVVIVVLGLRAVITGRRR